jgi:hypothetical protein
MNPVLSVWRTDIIYYGVDLPSYLAQEFDLPRSIRHHDESASGAT